MSERTNERPVCVCSPKTSQECAHTTPGNANRKTASCVRDFTRRVPSSSLHYTTTECIHYNYIQRESERNNYTLITSRGWSHAVA